MRYHIDTIPVWDAMKLDGECLLCSLHRRTELGEAERYLGASVMEPDTRIQVNDQGFCRAHHAMLFTMSNRLGHALMLESHNNVTRERMTGQFDRLRKAAKAYANAPLGRLTRAGAAAQRDLDAAVQEMTDMGCSCIMCRSIEENMDRYLHTFFHLFQNDTEFRRRFAQSKGVCLPHAADLIRVAQKELKAKELCEFVDLLADMEAKNFERMQEDISWFIKKFDYRFVNEPWKNSADAVPRTVNKLRGWCVGDEPNPKEK